MISGVLPFRSRDHEELFGLILTKEVKVPAFFSADAKDCVTRLLIKKPADRLGGGESGGAEVLAHPFFKAMDLEKLLAKEIPPPFVPKIGSATDVSNFDVRPPYLPARFMNGMPEVVVVAHIFSSFLWPRCRLSSHQRRHASRPRRAGRRLQRRVRPSKTSKLLRRRHKL